MVEKMGVICNECKDILTDRKDICECGKVAWNDSDKIIYCDEDCFEPVKLWLNKQGKVVKFKPLKIIEWEN